jgi:N-acetyl-gamma-glutamyl-phosphate reductase
MLRVAIIGASGYTGTELLRILARHSAVRITAATSEKSAGTPVHELFPHLAGLEDLTFEAFDAASVAPKADFFFMALPHTTGMTSVAAFLGEGKKVVDLSADFRLKSRDEYEKWYKVSHACPQWLESAVYGLPELHRESIRKTALVACPGCYPTGALLGLVPLIQGKRIHLEDIVINSLSGVSGAGRQPQLDYHFPEVNESAAAYGVTTHRHRPEIDQELSRVAVQSVHASFTPHLVPMTRGILTTVTARLKGSVRDGELRKLVLSFFADEPFVRVLPEGHWPATRDVRGSNHCHIGLAVDLITKRVTIVTAIDNLVKGASGQAVQCMNLMMGFDETQGLEAGGLFP